MAARGARTPTRDAAGTIHHMAMTRSKERSIWPKQQQSRRNDQSTFHYAPAFLAGKPSQNANYCASYAHLMDTYWSTQLERNLGEALISVRDSHAGKTPSRKSASSKNLN